MSNSHDTRGPALRRFIPALTDLQAFEAAARHLSFTRAAEELGVTQSAVSRNIGKLEDYLGVALFDRAGPKLVLTELGATYYADMHQLLGRMEEASIDVVRGRRADSALRIGTTPTMATRWLVPRLGDFFARHPEIPVELRMVGDREDFESGELDAAVLRGTGQWRGARAIELFPETLSVVCVPQLANLVEDAGRVDFTRQPTLQNVSRPSLWLTWLRLSGIAGSGKIQGNRFANSDMIISAALGGQGFAVLPRHYVTAELAGGRLVEPYPGGTRSGESFWLVVPERKWKTPQVAALRLWARGLVEVSPTPGLSAGFPAPQ